MNRLNTAYHNMAVHIGMGAVLILFALTVIIYILRIRQSRSQLFIQIDNALYVLLLAGLVGICLAIVSAFVDFPGTRALLLSPLVRVKFILSIIMFEVFLMMYYMRWKHGPTLWKSTSLSTYFLLLCLTGTAAVILAGSVGGYLALGETSMEGLDRMLGIPVN
ncbi:MAG: hypothetical protein ABR533_11500 [Desulfonatronovibrio sp.]